MFMAAGLVYAALGHDRIADLAGVARAMPVTVLAFAVAGLALMGVVPSGAYLAKKLMLDAADGSGQWWWTIVLQGGAVFTAGYVVLVLVSALRRRRDPIPIVRRVSATVRIRGAGARRMLAVARASPHWDRCRDDLVSSPLKPAELGSTLLVVAGRHVACAGAGAPVVARA